MSTSRSEADLAACVVEYLHCDGWEVYQEVDYGPGVADIVAVRKPLVWIIEVKTTYSAAVVEQAHHWIPWAHLVSVAVPPSNSRSRGRWVLDRCLRHAGIGRLNVVPFGLPFIKVPCRMTRQPPMVGKFRDALVEQQKTFAAAGNSDSKRWTPFHQTCTDLRSIVTKEPGISMSEAMGRLRHHYKSDASARSSLAHWIRQGVIEGLRVEGRPMRLYLAEAA